MANIEVFMVYELDDSGERNKLEIMQEGLESILHPEQVLVIVREDLRRIFIWKGPKSPVRKRFISSRVAQTLQEELMKDSRYHRCKIVSVDAGDEPMEFLKAFHLESMEVTERMADLRYIRNVERDGLVAQGSVVENKNFSQKAEIDEEYFSPALQELDHKVIASSLPENILRSGSGRKAVPITYPSGKMRGLSEERKKKVKEKILKTEISSDLKRLNLVIGHTLFAAVSKTTKIFGKDVEETDWEPVEKVPEGILILNEHVLRVYFDEKEGIVEAIEVLEKNNELKSNSLTNGNSTTKSSTQNKTSTSKKDTGRRELPKIPSNK